MDVEIKLMSMADAPLWDAYVSSHPHATVYHLSAWHTIISQTYKHDTYYLIAQTGEKNNEKLSHNSTALNGTTAFDPFPTVNSGSTGDRKSIVGILPLVHLRHFLFGNHMVSIPFVDLGGILADTPTVENALLIEAIKQCKSLNINDLELRHVTPLSCLNGSNDSDPHKALAEMGFFSRTLTHKVRLLLPLPASSENLMASFKAKLRSQIKKPIKEKLNSRIGGIELLDDFFNVFLVNMRDLGSPVHSRRLFANVLSAFPEHARIAIVFKDTKPIAASFFIGFKTMLANPWASALREFNRLSPNMLLYWTMLEYACDRGYQWFDFGRSSREEGTYHFKVQWGAQPQPLHWHYFALKDHLPDANESEKSRFETAIRYWKKLPVSVTKYVGPMIRKHIGL